jgi:hypothetical protein
MRANIRDARILSEVQPLNLFAYLRGRQWRELERVEKGSFWGKKDDEGEVEVLLPSDSALRDYANRISDLLKTLERVEGRSQLEIIEDLLVSSSDVIRPSGVRIPIFGDRNRSKSRKNCCTPDFLLCSGGT